MSGRPSSKVLAGWLLPVLLTLMSMIPLIAQRGGGGAPAVPTTVTRLESLEADLKLTKDQKKNARTILDDAHKSGAPIREALTRTRAAIAAAIQAGKAQADIDAAVSSYAEQATAMTALEMKALAQVLQALEPEQRANTAGVRSAFFLMRGIFLDKKWDEVPDARGY
jgi:Spy/CpxP family protein refolding chaperone